MDDRNTLRGSYLRALDAKTGATLWTVSTGSEYAYSSSPSVANGIVYVSGSRPNEEFATLLYALDAKTGVVRWTAPNVASDVTIANGVVYATGQDHLFAFDAKTGRVFWTYKVPEGLSGGAVVVVNGAVFAVARNKLYVFHMVSHS